MALYDRLSGSRRTLTDDMAVLFFLRSVNHAYPQIVDAIEAVCGSDLKWSEVTTVFAEKHNSCRETDAQYHTANSKGAVTAMGDDVGALFRCKFTVIFMLRSPFWHYSSLLSSRRFI